MCAAFGSHIVHTGLSLPVTRLGHCGKQAQALAGHGRLHASMLRLRRLRHHVRTGLHPHASACKTRCRQAGGHQAGGHQNVATWGSA
eukprot:362011-Chlamydomonas_euryale.AAC.3